MAFTGGLFRKAFPLAPRFQFAGLVAAADCDARTRAAGRIGHVVHARRPSTAAGTVLIHEPRPVCRNRGGRKGTADSKGDGKLAVPATARLLGLPSRLVARALSSAARAASNDAPYAGGPTQLVQASNWRESPAAGRDHRTNFPRHT